MTNTRTDTSLDAFRREAADAAHDEEAKATRRFLNAMILHHEAQADGIASFDPTRIQCETWAYNRGVAEGLRMALKALSLHKEDN